MLRVGALIADNGILGNPSDAIVGSMVVAGIAILGALIENTRRISLARTHNASVRNTRVYYDCLNLHLSLTLGMLALVLGAGCSGTEVMLLVGMIFVGVVAKGVFSNHTPERLVWRDRDALIGLIIPNGMGASSVLFTLASTCVAGNATMILVIVAAGAIAIGVVLSVAGSIVTDSIVRRFVGRSSRICADRRDELDSILRHKEGNGMHQESVSNLESTLMDYIMTTPSLPAAMRMLNSLHARLDTTNPTLIRKAEEALRARIKEECD